jgi:hypothetical protein
VRFYKEEEKNDAEFAKKLAANADLYVNDAFGTAHRAHASTEGVTKFLKPSVSGFLLRAGGGGGGWVGLPGGGGGRWHVLWVRGLCGFLLQKVGVVAGGVLWVGAGCCWSQFLTPAIFGFLLGCVLYAVPGFSVWQAVGMTCVQQSPSGVSCHPLTNKYADPWVRTRDLGMPAGAGLP